jgi:hypothetical protein
MSTVEPMRTVAGTASLCTDNGTCVSTPVASPWSAYRGSSSPAATARSTVAPGGSALPADR